MDSYLFCVSALHSACYYSCLTSPWLLLAFPLFLFSIDHCVHRFLLWHPLRPSQGGFNCLYFLSHDQVNLINFLYCQLSRAYARMILRVIFALDASPQFISEIRVILLKDLNTNFIRRCNSFKRVKIKVTLSIKICNY